MTDAPLYPDEIFITECTPDRAWVKASHIRAQAMEYLTYAAKSECHGDRFDANFCREQAAKYFRRAGAMLKGLSEEQKVMLKLEYGR